MEPEIESLTAWFKKNRGRAIGAGLGLVIGVLILALGFWRGLFLTACVWVGWVLGARVDAHESLAELISRLLPPGE